ncbi:MAG: S8 family peptidase [Candidatus Heimdallarchaeota archaeon]
MDDKKLRTVIWSIVIIIIVISIGIMAFLMISLPNRTGGEGVRIAVLDSGINQDIRFGSYKVSRELDGSVILNKSFVTTEYGYSSNASIVDDTDGYHGTRVAMQIASRSFGEAPQADLIIARCADAQGTATYPALIAAIEWAAYVADADIINISIGGPTITNNTIVELINKIALEEGILTVVSSGNSGDADGYSLSAIEAPADALQAIAVGASDFEGIAFYSSPGPLKDHSIKPDLVDSGNTLSALGTSFAAPKVTGKAASLMSWCIEQGYKTSPGLLKAALMKSASFDFSVPEYYFGAGIADIELAKEIITSAPKVNNWPMVIYVSPTELPIFQGDFWSFPLTIITPIEQVFNFTSDKSESSSIIVIQDEITINQSGLVNCLLNVTDEYPVGDLVESLYIQGSIGGAFSVDIDVEIASPDLRLGFDTYHSLWDMDHLFGQFRELRLELALANVALTELSHKDNFTQLDNN